MVTLTFGWLFSKYEYLYFGNMLNLSIPAHLLPSGLGYWKMSTYILFWTWLVKVTSQKEKVIWLLDLRQWKKLYNISAKINLYYDFVSVPAYSKAESLGYPRRIPRNPVPSSW